MRCRPARARFWWSMPRQGVEAQTLANLYLAMENDLEIIPVINKIDLVSAQPDAVAQEIEEILGVPAAGVLRVSAKDGHQRAKPCSAAVVETGPAPAGAAPPAAACADLRQPLRCL